MASLGRAETGGRETKNRLTREAPFVALIRAISKEKRYRARSRATHARQAPVLRPTASAPGPAGHGWQRRR